MDTRNTKQRTYIIDYLRERSQEHHTADQIYSELKESHPQLGISTVYRNLRLLEGQKLIEKVMDGSTAVYKILENSGALHSHHHMICRECGRIIDFEDDLLEAIEKIIHATKDFTVTDHRLTFYGICGECSAKVKADS